MGRDQGKTHDDLATFVSKKTKQKAHMMKLRMRSKENFVAETALNDLSQPMFGCVASLIKESM